MDHPEPRTALRKCWGLSTGNRIRSPHPLSHAIRGRVFIQACRPSLKKSTPISNPEYAGELDLPPRKLGDNPVYFPRIIGRSRRRLISPRSAPESCCRKCLLSHRASELVPSLKVSLEETPNEFNGSLDISIRDIISTGLETSWNRVAVIKAITRQRRTP